MKELTKTQKKKWIRILEEKEARLSDDVAFHATKLNQKKAQLEEVCNKIHKLEMDT